MDIDCITLAVYSAENLSHSVRSFSSILRSTTLHNVLYRSNLSNDLDAFRSFFFPWLSNGNASSLVRGQMDGRTMKKNTRAINAKIIQRFGKRSERVRRRFARFWTSFGRVVLCLKPINHPRPK